MAQHSTFVPTYSALSCSVNVKQETQHITEAQTRTQNIDMITYNASNNNNEMNIANSGGNTFTLTNSSVPDQTAPVLVQNPNTGATLKDKLSKHQKQQQPRKPPPTIETFWPTILQEVQNAVIDSKHQSLPLARIKKIMKLDENAKMIAAEAPTLFAKACEFFIQELTMRAWIHTDESKRRTLQRSDIAQAIANYDQFDFLIDIVPREDIKPPSHRRNHNDNTSTTGLSASPVTNASASSNPTMTTSVSNVVTGEIFNVSNLPLENASAPAATNAQPSTAASTSGGLNQTQPTQIVTTTNHTPQLQIIQQAAHPQQHLQYFITIPGQQSSNQAQLVHQLQLQQQQQNLGSSLATSTPITAASLNLVTQQPQQLILTATNPATAQSANVVQHQAALLQNIAQHHQQQHTQQPQQQVQLVHQVMLTPNGEIANVPLAINANQLNLLRLQMQQQQQQQQQQIIIPAHLLTHQQLLQLQTQTQNQVGTGTTAHIVHQPQQQSTTQHHNQTPTTTNNIFIHANAGVANQASSGAAASMVSTDRNMGSTFRNNC